MKAVAVAASDRLGVPLRHFSSVRYCGDFYGQAEDGAPNYEAISVESLTTILASLRTGVTELACHPGLDDDVEGMYRTERAVELATLCNAGIRERLDSLGIELKSFADREVAPLRLASSTREGG